MRKESQPSLESLFTEIISIPYLEGRKITATRRNGGLYYLSGITQDLEHDLSAKWKILDGYQLFAASRIERTSPLTFVIHGDAVEDYGIEDAAVEYWHMLLFIDYPKGSEAAINAKMSRRIPHVPREERNIQTLITNIVRALRNWISKKMP